jgi:aryl-phospho-beta-D-glucosidase BglC (GH1 family)
VLTLLLAIALTLHQVQPDAPGGGDAAARATALARGINISHWYWIAHDPSPAGVGAFLTAADADQLKRLGLTHVRIPVEPDYLWDASRGELRKDNLERYRAGIALFTSRGMGVVVDPHPSRTPWADPKDPAFADRYERFWNALAGALRDTDPNLVFLEVMNEPHDLPDKQTWPRQQARFVATIRAAAPRHTIIATGDDWGSIEGLVRLEPLADDNVIYTFHFYDPHTFTHQGATWGAPNWKNLRDVPYPSSPELVKESLEKTTDERGKGEVRWYGEQRWNAQKIESRIKAATEWGKSHHAVLWCGEFGAYRETTPADSRRAWLHDLTGAMQEAGIGWCMWDYAGGFGLMSGEPGGRRPHDDTADAIGLHAAE